MVADVHSPWSYVSCQTQWGITTPPAARRNSPEGDGPVKREVEEFDLDDAAPPKRPRTDQSEPLRKNSWNAYWGWRDDPKEIFFFPRIFVPFSFFKCYFFLVSFVTFCSLFWLHFRSTLLGPHSLRMWWLTISGFPPPAQPNGFSDGQTASFWVVTWVNRHLYPVCAFVINNVS